MFDIGAFFKRVFGGQREDTRSAAKERLRLVLVSDRAMVAPQIMDQLRKEIIQVISKYMDIDTCSMQIDLERQEGFMALAANIPVRSVRRSSAEFAALTAQSELVAAVVHPEPRLDSDQVAKTEAATDLTSQAKVEPPFSATREAAEEPSDSGVLKAQEQSAQAEAESSPSAEAADKEQSEEATEGQTSATVAKRRLRRRRRNK